MLISQWNEECPACYTMIYNIWQRSYLGARLVECPYCCQELHIVSIGNSLYGLGLPEETTSQVVARYVSFKQSLVKG